MNAFIASIKETYTAPDGKIQWVLIQATVIVAIALIWGVLNIAGVI